MRDFLRKNKSFFLFKPLIKLNRFLLKLSAILDYHFENPIIKKLINWIERGSELSELRSKNNTVFLKNHWEDTLKNSDWNGKRMSYS